MLSHILPTHNRFAGESITTYNNDNANDTMTKRVVEQENQEYDDNRQLQHGHYRTQHGLQDEERDEEDRKEEEWSPPSDQPGCMPVFGTHPLLLHEKKLKYYDEDEEEFLEDNIYDTKMSSTSSGDSGYGTHRHPTKEEKKHTAAQDIFESILKPPPSNSISSSSTHKANNRLSLLFSSKNRHKKEPHFVKFQTWSNNKANYNQQQYKKSASVIEGKSPYVPQPDLLPIAKRKSTNSLKTNNVSHLELFDEDGNLLARYKLGNVIGKGHFGTVYRALDLISGKTVAIKQINLKSSKKQDIEDMMQEARLLSSLTHPNIVKYEGFIQTQEHINIVLEYVENGSLLNTLKSFGSSLPESLVANYCQRILSGLIYLHQQQVVHCDLKAANILTTKAGDVKLSDFGVSLNLKLKKNEDESIVSGTPFWMSPEVIELKGASSKSDIWSLGCTIIELYTGKPPYSDLIAMTAMFKIVEDECPPIPDGVSAELHDFLMLCFRKNPIDRPTASELLDHPWILKYQKPLEVSSTTSSPILMAKKPTAQSLTRKVRSNSTLLNQMQEHAVVAGESLLAKKLQQRQQLGHLSTRQSMPVVSNTHVRPKPSHMHSLIDCSFPKGAGNCKVCDIPIKRDAFVCKDFCGYVCHKRCKSPEAQPKAPHPVRPTSSVSSQLREKFSISRLISRTQHEPSSSIKNPWWKKKSSK
ncbi:hypothetical protein CU097_009917 [Rhizopus azygosporus]|uniref:Protein kinase domain-containing protein n=1 Tax=Rhizopus azygosporus TaxID=86630 RepID=A0A367JEI4_RHIAZ|nr:hypothetical protein CU097_009917 [Rhizopus azygosporus]